MLPFAAQHAWPDAIDLAATLALLGTLIGISFAGYVLCALDVRAWWLSLRRALIVLVDRGPRFVSGFFWDTPRCLRTFGLTLPCSEDQLRQVYRTMAKELHPDRGGDRRRFLRLQADFEESLAEIRRLAASGSGNLDLRSL